MDELLSFGLDHGDMRNRAESLVLRSAVRCGARLCAAVADSERFARPTFCRVSSAELDRSGELGVPDQK